MFFGVCTGCAADADGRVTADGDFYCHECWEVYDASFFRCMTLCAVYDSTGKRLTFATSVQGCAERAALWKLKGDLVNAPKILVAARIRKTAKGRMTFGNSKPCMYCVMALKMYNVERVSYSTLTQPASSIDDTSAFAWEDSKTLKSELLSKSNVIVKTNVGQ